MKAKYNQETRDWYTELLKDKPLEKQIVMLEISERQKYNYYCDCSDNWTTEQNKEYESQWNEIIEMLNELKSHETSKIIIR
jgi:hypothetical protein